MSIHHLNCGTMRPRGSFGGRLAPDRMVAHCLLVERPGGLLLVDTGFGTADVADPGRLGQPFVGDDVLLVPLRGHTRGHCGVAVRRPDGGWLLHAGDSYFHTSEKETPPSPPVGLRVFQRLLEVDHLQRTHNQERLRELYAAHRDEITIFCAHDVSEFEALATPVG